MSKEPEVIVSNEPWKKPLPNIDKDNAEFYEGLKRHQFLVWRCKKCGASYWPKAYCQNHENEPFAANMDWAPATRSYLEAAREVVLPVVTLEVTPRPGFPKRVLDPEGLALLRSELGLDSSIRRLLAALDIDEK